MASNCAFGGCVNEATADAVNEGGHWSLPVCPNHYSEAARWHQTRVIAREA